MDQIDTLFIRTLSDIAVRIRSDDPYEILGASALIRKLFLDDNPLVDQVNRKYRIKVEFEIAESQVTLPGEPKPTFYTVQDGIDPDTARPGKAVKVVNRDKLFKTVLTVANNYEYTLREIILFEANVMGGVHAGSAKSEKEKALKQINDTFAVGGFSSSLRQLKAVGRVILKGLSPLKKQIEDTSI